MLIVTQVIICAIRFTDHSHASVEVQCSDAFRGSHGQLMLAPFLAHDLAGLHSKTFLLICSRGFFICPSSIVLSAAMKPPALTLEETGVTHLAISSDPHFQDFGDTLKIVQHSLSQRRSSPATAIGVRKASQAPRLPVCEALTGTAPGPEEMFQAATGITSSPFSIY